MIIFLFTAANGSSLTAVGGSRSDTFVLDMDGMSNWGNASTANNDPGTSRDVTENPSASPQSPRESEDQEVGTNPDDPEPNGSGERSPADLIRDSPETRAFINEINKYTTLRPFLLIMLLKVSTVSSV